MIFIYPYRKGSNSVKLLKAEMPFLRAIKLVNSKFKWKKPVINWGNSKPLGECINRNTSMATNKIKTFLALDGKVGHVPYTLDKAEALKWVEAGKTVFARTSITGNSGKGIVILNEKPETVAPLYTMYVKKKAEYRVHVAFGKVIHIQEKKKKHGVQHSMIQSHNNGYIFGKPVFIPESLVDVGIAALQHLHLDFGAVDIIWNEKQGKCFILEVNTAPGLSPSTAKLYAQAFKEHFHV